MSLFSPNEIWLENDSSLGSRRFAPTYEGIAVVAGVSAYVGSKAVGKIPTDYQVYAKAAGIIYTGYSASENIDPESRSFMDPVLNIRESSYDSISRNTEVKSELNFENLITE